MTVTSLAPPRRGLPMAYRLRLTGFLFTLPALLFFFCFRLYPMLRAIQISFMQFDFLSPGTFVGLDNYVELLQD